MDIEVGAGEQERGLPWGPSSSAEGSGWAPLLTLSERLVWVFIDSHVSSPASSFPPSYPGSSYPESLGEIKHPVSWNPLSHLVNREYFLWLLCLTTAYQARIHMS